MSVELPIRQLTTFTPKLILFIPVFNEIKNVKIIENNVRKTIKVFGDAKIYISDNKSDDGTWEKLEELKSQYHTNIFLYQQKNNIGFSRNICSIPEVMYGEKDESMVLILGANDLLYTRGLRYIKNIMLNKCDVDFIMCNWAYCINKKQRYKIIERCDVDKKFECYNLEEFFNNHNYIPNGIMQYLLKFKLLKKVNVYSKLSNPLTGVFMDAFPCSFVASANPPLALVLHKEDGGWRSNANSIYKSHCLLIEEIFGLLETAYIKNVISKKNFIKIKYIYTFNLTKLLFSLYEGNWGKWNGCKLYSISHFERIYYIISLCITKNKKNIFKLLRAIFREHLNAIFKKSIFNKIS